MPRAELSCVMAMQAPNSALERLLRPLSRELSADLARALVNLEADDETQDRYDQLAEKHSAGQLTAVETAELEGMVRANTILGILKVEAQTFLANGKPS